MSFFSLFRRVSYTNNVLLCEQVINYDNYYYDDDEVEIKRDEDSLRGSRRLRRVSSLFKFISFYLKYIYMYFFIYNYILVVEYKYITNLYRIQTTRGF